MADVFDKIAPDQKGDIFDQVSQPKGMGFGDTLFDTYARAGMGAYDAMKWIPGVKELANITPGPSADQLSQNLKSNANFGQQVVQGTGQGLATIPQVLPFVKAASAIPVLGTALGGTLAPVAGMAGYGATTAGMQGQNPLVGAAQGAGQGMAFSAGGALGSKLGQMAMNPIARAIGGSMGGNIAKAAPSVGTTLGMAGAGAATSPDAPASGALVGGALGALNPMGEKSYQETLQDAADTHAKILGLGKGVIQKVEQKSGKDLNDSYQLAAQHGLIYNKGQEGRLDTTQAQAQLQPFMDDLHNHANTIVSSDPNKQFDLQQLADQAKTDLRNDPKFKNDLAYNQAKDQIDAHVDAAISNRGQFVDAPTLNNIKQGMWNASFEPLQPNNNAVARQLGNTAKSALEQAFPNSDLGGVNAKLGKYLDLKAVLANANGNIIDRGKLGKYVAEGVGGGLGMVAGAAVPVPILHEAAMGAGALAGTKVGEAVNAMQTDPERITRNLANKVQLSQLANGVNVRPTLPSVPKVPPQNGGLGQFNPAQASANPQGTILGPNGQPINPMANPVKPQPNFGNGIKALGIAGAIGAGSMFNPLNANAQQVKEPERLQLPGDQYTKKEEGFQSTPYIDTKGNKTIGYGFNMKAVGNMLPELVREGKAPLTKPMADKIYTKLYANARNAAQDFAGDGWDNLNGQQQKSLIDMSYNMGGAKLGGFKNLHQAIEDGDYQRAYREILNSNYAKEAPNRAMRNATLIRG